MLTFEADVLHGVFNDGHDGWVVQQDVAQLGEVQRLLPDPARLVEHTVQVRAKVTPVLIHVPAIVYAFLTEALTDTTHIP